MNNLFRFIRLFLFLLINSFLLIGCGAADQAAIEVQNTDDTSFDEKSMPDDASDMNSQETEEDTNADIEEEEQKTETDNQTIPDATEPIEIYNLSREFSIEDEMYTYCLSFVEDEMYYDFEGDIGDVLSEYKDIDIDGDGKADKIERFKANEDYGGYTYLLSFSNGSTLHTKTFSSSPNEGEVIELKDLNGDHIDEILFTHYTYGTGGPTTWDVYLYYWSDKGKWESITITDDNNHNLVQDLGDESVPGESFIHSPGVELTDDGLAVLVDYGMKDGPQQTFDLDVFLFNFENGNLSLAEHSADLVEKYWPKNVDGIY